MPLRRNRRQFEQLTDFDRGRIIGLREAGWSNRRIGTAPSVGRYGSCLVFGNSGSQKVECTVAEGQDVPGTQMIARIVQSEEWPLRHQQRRYRFNATYLLQTSSAIKRNHKGDD
ncbi:hypothetical protein TNCV_4462621 [Trichonephila clavipes]|nr:hypothetical protein TNCV_4462621 [Trichonephila clavipes]